MCYGRIKKITACPPLNLMTQKEINSFGAACISRIYVAPHRIKEKLFSRTLNKKFQENRIIYLNMNLLSKISPAQRRKILLHEFGHVRQSNYNKFMPKSTFTAELEADAFAIRAAMKERDLNGLNLNTSLNAYIAGLKYKARLEAIEKLRPYKHALANLSKPMNLESFLNESDIGKLYLKKIAEIDLEEKQAIELMKKRARFFASWRHINAFAKIIERNNLAKINSAKVFSKTYRKPCRGICKKILPEKYIKNYSDGLALSLKSLISKLDESALLESIKNIDSKFKEKIIIKLLEQSKLLDHSASYEAILQALKQGALKRLRWQSILLKKIYGN